MNRIALSIVGGLMGFAGGLAVVPPVTASFGTTSVTWNASSCPPGVYSITSVARGPFGFAAQSVTTDNVSLPKASVTQEFVDLGPRNFLVSATAKASDGRTFKSDTQTIYGDGGSSARFGRARPTEMPVTGFARSRTTRPPAPPPTDPRSVAPIAAAAPIPDVAPLAPTRAEGAAVLRRILTQLGIATDPDAVVAGWRQMVVEDVDGDGVIDVVSIEWNDGGVSVIRINLNLTGPSGLR